MRMICEYGSPILSARRLQSSQSVGVTCERATALPNRRTDTILRARLDMFATMGTVYHA